MTLFVLSTLVALCVALEAGMEYTESFLNGRVTLEWAIINNNTAIEMLVTGQATGWIGVGVSPQGGMQGADITLGWLDETTGAPVLSDRYVGSAPGTPLMDKEQNVKLISLTVTGGKIAMRFRRGLDSCDPNAGQDLAIKGTSRVLVAMGNGAFDKHATQDRTSKSIDLRRGKIVPLPTETDLKNWDIKLNNAAMPGEQTTYWSVGAVFPENKQVHAVRFEVLIPPSDLAFTHHYLLYACRKPLSASSQKWVGNRKDEPADVRACVGVKPIYGWAIGGLDISIPPKVGVPIDAGQHFVLEIHIDRPEKQAIVANCGLRVKYTQQLRPYQAALVHFGAATDVWLTIPVTSGPSVRRSFCYRECTEDLIPAKTYAFGAMGHMHFAGRGFKLRHMRNNNQIELAPLVDNPTYDNQLQSMTFFEEHVEIRAGDTFMVEGTFVGTSDGRKTPTFGGSSSWDEMMLAYVYMYSESGPVTLGDCSSSAVSDVMYKELIARQAFGGVTLNRNEPLPSFVERITDWSKYDSARDAAERSGKALIEPKCFKSDGTKLDVSPKPGVYPQQEYAAPRVCVAIKDMGNATDPNGTPVNELPVFISTSIQPTASATTTNGATSLSLAAFASVAQLVVVSTIVLVA